MLGYGYRLFRYSDNILFLSYNSTDISCFKSLFFKFLELRGLSLEEEFCSLKFSFNSFKLLDWNFFHYRNHLFCTMSDDKLKDYKRVLKIIVNNSIHSTIFDLINLLNAQIILWVVKLNYLDFLVDVCGQMDVFLFKLLWKWARRRHPRRTNVWIYSKYWKYFFGSWRVFSVDSFTGKVRFLKSHFFRKFNIHRFPLSLNIFDFYNQRKLNNILCKRTQSDFIGIYKILADNQKGLCFVCNKPFDTCFFSNLRVLSILKSFDTFSTLVSHLILVHYYCNLT